MKVCVIGTGYVGLVTGACLAHIGHDVICIDTDAAKVEKMRSGIAPIFEPGLEDIMHSAMQTERLQSRTVKFCSLQLGHLLCPRERVIRDM
jgi:UDPglucose 6-dehydrogenase